MSDKREYEKYKNIDYENIDDVTPKANTENNAISQQHTLDFYNDDIAKKAVNSLFKVYEEKSSDTNLNEEKTSKKFGYDGTEKQNIVKKPRLTPNIQTDESILPENTNNKDSVPNSKTDYSYKPFEYEKESEQSYKGYKYYNTQKDYDFRNTSFSQEKIKKEQEAREEVKRNQEILRKLQMQETNSKELLEVGLYKTVKEHEKEQKMNKKAKTLSANEKKRKNTIIFRVSTTIFIIVILIALIVNIISNRNLKKKLAEYETNQIDTVTETELNGEISSLENDIKILNDEISKLRAENEKMSNNVNSSVTENETNTSTTNTYTVKSGDTLSKISQEVYGDPNKYNLIVDANNLTSQNLSAGQVLTIPN